jgi:hypothetical protein
VIEQLSGILMLDIAIPTTDGRELRMKRFTKPDKVQQLVLNQLNLDLPDKAPPEIHHPAAASAI